VAARAAPHQGGLQCEACRYSPSQRALALSTHFILTMTISMNYSNILHDRRGATSWITLNRPADLNAISAAMVEELIDVLTRIAIDDAVRVVVVTGVGEKAFCAGADLKGVLAILERSGTPGEPDFLDRATVMFELLRGLRKPVIAAVNGVALAGGLEIVMACDLVLAADTAKLGDAHANFGVFPGAGGAAVLPRKVGINRAKQLLFTGDSCSAEEMKAFGLVNDVVPASELPAAAQKLADKLAAKSPSVLRAMKAVANRSLDQTQAAALRDEMLALRDHLRSADLREGLAAFAAKRKPVFTGR
jgi:enoyl-CoA hydratase